MKPLDNGKQFLEETLLEATRIRTVIEQEREYFKTEIEHLPPASIDQSLLYRIAAGFVITYNRLVEHELVTSITANQTLH